ncbi:MAG: corrinoid protein [Candidatus Hadarchaeum sp.]|uniref:cobalamin B12-binding domain-containing protein n=1 Tax=Candidatus Hadarchaeum sp. TaxID=2883567 RepID=UPI00317ED338
MSMSKEEILKELREGVLNYDEERVKRAAKKALEDGIDPYVAITEGLTPAIREIGEKFERMEIFLPQLTIAAKAMEAGVAVLEPSLDKAQGQKVKQGKVVIGTVQGDIHSIGKNIVATMLKAAGFEVIDLGVDVAVDKFIEAAERSNADIIAASALMSFTKVMQRDLVEYMKSVGTRDKYKLMVGGGPVNEEWAREIGADGYAEDAIKAVKVAKELVEKKL